MMILVKPKVCLQDEKVQLILKNFQPFQRITISSHMKDHRDKKYFSYAHYKIDKYGGVDVSKDHSFGGHYTGVFQMGLVSAFVPEPNEYKYLRLFKKDVSKPNKITFCVYEDHLTPIELFKKDAKLLNTALHYRHFMAPGVRRVPIKTGRVRGTLFIPPGKGPFPGIIDMFGTAGGCLEYRSAQLASRGIASLALAFFAYDDLPTNPSIFDMTYFRDAVHVLLSYDQVCKPGVGAIGVSKGGDLTLSMAVHIPEVSLAICINGCNANLTFPLKLDDNKIIPPLIHEMSLVTILDDKSIITNRSFLSSQDYPDTIIPIHKTDAAIMFVVGDDDKNMDSKGYAIEAEELMKKHGKHNYKILYYKDAGHLIEPPYSAFCPVSYHKIVDMVMNWGGDLMAHTYAQEDSWEHMIDFIKENLQHQIKSKL